MRAVFVDYHARHVAEVGILVLRHSAAAQVVIKVEDQPAVVAQRSLRGQGLLVFLDDLRHSNFNMISQSL